MKLKILTDERNRLMKHILMETNIYQDELLNRTYHFVSANLLHFLPKIDVSCHETIFRNIILNQQLSVLEQTDPAIMDSVRVEGLTEATLATLKTSPAIIGTFHMGSNRLVSHYLAAHNIPFSLVMANHIAEGEGAAFINMYTKLYKSYSGHELNIIEAHRSNSAFKMLRELKQGRSLLVYVDGNTGAGDDSIYNRNKCRIKFLNQLIYARKGIGYISHMANVPVIPAFCYRQNIDDIHMRFLAAIYPDRRMERDKYAPLLIQQLYDLFAPVLQQYPEQWECWIYLHTITDTTSLTTITDHQPKILSSSTTFRFNKKEYGFFNIASEKYLFHKRTYKFYRIGEDIYNLLFTSAQQPVKKEKIEAHVFQQLQNRYVLINA